MTIRLFHLSHFFHRTSWSEYFSDQFCEIGHICKVTLTLLKQNTKWEHNNPLKDILQIDDGPPMPSSSSTKENTHQDIFLQIETGLFINWIQLSASSKVTAYILQTGWPNPPATITSPNLITHCCWFAWIVNR